MGATASYLIFCDPAPANLGLRTDVELLHINSQLIEATPFRVADKPNVFLNKQGVDIGPITTDLIRVDADVVLEGNAKRGFRIYLCIEGIPCVGVGNDPLQAIVNGGRALLRADARLGEQDRDCSDYLDAMLKREEDKLDASAPMSANKPTVKPAVTEAANADTEVASQKNQSEKVRTAAIIKTILNR